MSDPIRVARLFHETYERLAPSFGYETRKASAVPWDDVPENNRRLMIAVAAEVVAALSTTPAPTVTYEIVATALRAVGLDYIEGKAREDEVDWIAGRLTDAIRSALSTTPAPDPRRLVDAAHAVYLALATGGTPTWDEYAALGSALNPYVLTEDRSTP